MGILRFDFKLAQKLLPAGDNHRAVVGQLLIPEFQFRRAGPSFGNALQQGVALWQKFFIFVQRQQINRD